MTIIGRDFPLNEGKKTQASFLQGEERQVSWGRREEEVAKDILSLGFLSWFNILLGDESIKKKLLGFSRERVFLG